MGAALVKTSGTFNKPRQGKLEPIWRRDLRTRAATTAENSLPKRDQAALLALNIPQSLLPEARADDDGDAKPRADVYHVLVFHHLT
ncbi:hypothetical protein PoB_003037000 [Plakobranchus ocellatus]|uniref:Uncharacterized protein n=1 Tax=Plakobranchus ocellatus TaxID=259542 RepID=A0AAV4A6R5_9GAST|nr:hypothetical protein PoB_003037000 [Plakobranchus ocellatus]